MSTTSLLSVTLEMNCLRALAIGSEAAILSELLLQEMDRKSRFQDVLSLRPQRAYEIVARNAHGS